MSLKTDELGIPSSWAMARPSLYSRAGRVSPPLHELVFAFPDDKSQVK
jgi:hypothetical protein